jgi:hypothetical protein
VVTIAWTTHSVEHCSKVGVSKPYIDHMYESSAVNTFEWRAAAAVVVIVVVVVVVVACIY